jgi:hypothetical protein
MEAGVMAADTPKLEMEDLRRRLRERPFQPFRLYLHDGRVFDVHFPHLNLVGRTFIMVGIPEPNNPDPIGEYGVLVLFDDIRQVENIDEVVVSFAG